MTARILIWAAIACLGATAIAQLSTAAVRLWPVWRSVCYLAGVFFGQVFVWLFRSWLKRRAARKRERLGLAFDPIRRLRR